MIKQIIIIGLCCIVAQVVNSAPSGCVDLCNSEKQTAGLSTYQTHAALQNLQQALNHQLHESQMNLDYTRPGNWSEHNQWATDNGAGKVHEERGQLEAGNAKVQYYKKNYTASFGSGNLNNAMNNFLNSQNTAATTDLLNQRQVEDFRGSTNHAATADISSELESRLHQLRMQMEQFNSNIHQYSLPMTTTSSFESHMSQLKNRVDQVNNQIQQNAQLQSSSPQAQQHLQQLIQGYESRMQELQRMLDQMTREASQVSQTYHQQQQRPQYTERIVVPETNTQQQQQHHYEYKSHHEQHIKSHSGYVPTSQTYVIPSDNLQQQVYVPNDHITSLQSQYHHGNQNIVRVPIHQGNRYQNYREETGQELETGTDNVQHNVYNQNSGKHVEEHWSASGHRSESVIPHHQQQQQQQVVSDSFDKMRQQHQSGHSGHYTSGGSSSSSVYQQSGGQFRTGVLDLGQTADCDTETTQSQYKSSPYSQQRRYRRGIRDGFSQQTEDLTQQTEDLTQQTEDLTQQTFDNINQQSQQQQQQYGRRHHHEHDHDHVNRHQGQETEDFSQQHQTQSQIGQLEPGNQRHHESAYDRYGQQTTDYPSHHHRHNHNDQDYYNRHEHRGQNDYSRHQSTQQQTQDLTQQTEGFGDYSQQSAGNLELTQQSENLNQNSYGSRQQQQLQNNNDANPVVGIEGANWHTQHHSGDLTSDNYQQQQQQQYGLNSQTSGITLAPGTYGHQQHGLEVQDEFGYPGDDVVTSTTNKPGFWKGVSNKISKTYEKAKDKVSDVFG